MKETAVGAVVIIGKEGHLRGNRPGVLIPDGNLKHSCALFFSVVLIESTLQGDAVHTRLKYQGCVFCRCELNLG